MNSQLKTKGPHQGQILENIIRKNGYSISEISRNAPINRRTLYNCFTQEKLKRETIEVIAKAIDQDLYELCGIDKVEPPAPPVPDNLWIGKYIKLLESYNELLKQNCMIKK